MRCGSMALFAISVMCGMEVGASSPIDLTGFNASNGNVLVCGENFNSGIGRWTLGGGFELRRNEGMTGSAALFSQVLAGKRSENVASCPIKVVPGAICKVALRYRVKDIIPLNSKDRRTKFILGYIQTYGKDGRKLKSQNLWTRYDFNPEWQSLCTSVTIPDDAVEKAELVPVFDWWHSGQIWFDDIDIESGDAAVILPVEPSNLALDKDGTVSFRIYRHNGGDAQYLALLVDLNGTSKLLYPKADVFSGKFGLFSGAVNVSAKLLNMRGDCKSLNFQDALEKK